MRGFVARFIINLLLLALVTWMFPGIEVTGPIALIFAGIVLGLLNAFLRPILILITLPLTILTIGIFIFVINGLMIWLTSGVVDGFKVSGFWTAVGTALVYSVLSMIVSFFLSDAGRIEVIHLHRRA
ncbi:MAG: phage holin family protein [Candidatus Abyssubacteria bacterium]